MCSVNLSLDQLQGSSRQVAGGSVAPGREYEGKMKSQAVYYIMSGFIVE